jgi:hypothetical protein
VFGGIERDSGNCFLVPVLNGRAKTLLPIINSHILPETTIISACWAAYSRISETDTFLHKTVNHSYNFVNPLDMNVHTQNIEIVRHMPKDLLKLIWNNS